MAKKGKQAAKTILPLAFLLLVGVASLVNIETTFSRIAALFQPRSLGGKSYKAQESCGDEHHVKAEPEHQLGFYDNHITQIRSLIRSTSIVDWHTRGGDDELHRPLLDNFHMTEFSKEDDYVASLSSSVNYVNHQHDGLCSAALAFQKYWSSTESPEPRPHVLFSGLSENWGAMSTEIVNKTVDWGDLEENWKGGGCSKESIWAYLNHHDTVMVVTMQFQKFSHPKVHSLPLGVQTGAVEKILDIIQQMLDDDAANKTKTTRKQLLMVNNSPYKTRLKTLSIVNQTFNGTLINTFRLGTTRDYYREMLKSKFILSPGGMGIDCYRNWEAIYLGTIPVIETLNRTDGWFRSFDDLPVTFIDSYENLTPEFLKQEHWKIIQRPERYNYEKTTKQYWIRFIKETAQRYNHSKTII